jgi:phosphoribosylformylglycinamidine synthase subunit PurL
MSVDGNGRFCYLDPFRGAMLAVAEAARNVACAGALPIGATNNLNFGNPEKPEIMWQFAEAVAASARPAARSDDSDHRRQRQPLQRDRRQGHLPDARARRRRPHRGRVRRSSAGVPADGADIVLLGENRGELGGSEYLKAMHGEVRARPPRSTSTRERALIALLAEARARGPRASAHDCSDGGLAVTLAECCFDTGGIGCRG